MHCWGQEQQWAAGHGHHGGICSTPSGVVLSRRHCELLCREPVIRARCTTGGEVQVLGKQTWLANWAAECDATTTSPLLVTVGCGGGAVERGFLLAIVVHSLPHLRCDEQCGWGRKCAMLGARTATGQLGTWGGSRDHGLGLVPTDVTGFSTSDFHQIAPTAILTCGCVGSTQRRRCSCWDYNGHLTAVASWATNTMDFPSCWGTSGVLPVARQRPCGAVVLHTGQLVGLRAPSALSRAVWPQPRPRAMTTTGLSAPTASSTFGCTVVRWNLGRARQETVTHAFRWSFTPVTLLLGTSTTAARPYNDLNAPWCYTNLEALAWAYWQRAVAGDRQQPQPRVGNW